MAEKRASYPTIPEQYWIQTAEWQDVTENDTLIPVRHPEYGEVTLEASGNFGSGGQAAWERSR